MGAAGWQLMPFPDLKSRGPWHWRISQPQCQSKFCCTRVYTCKHNRTKTSPPSAAFRGLHPTPLKGGVRRWRGAGDEKGFSFPRQAKGRALEPRDRFPRLLRRVLSCPESPWVPLLVCSWESQSRSEVWPELVLGRSAQAGTVWFRGNPSPYRRVSPPCP